MPSPAAIILDGTMAYGSQIVTINGVQYKADDIKISRPVTYADDEDHLGRPQRRRATAGRSELTATLQLATSVTTRPAFGSAGVLSGTFDSNYGVEYFALDPVEYEEAAAPGDIRKMPVKGWKLLQGTAPTAV